MTERVEAIVRKVRNLPATRAKAASGDVVTFNYDQLGERAKATKQVIAYVKRRSLDTVKAIVDVGEALAKIKRTLRRGEWLPLLEAELGMSDRNARRLMRIAELAKGKTGDTPVLSQSLFIEIFGESTPEAAREQILGRVVEGERVTVRDARAVISAEKAKAGAPAVTKATTRALSAPIAAPALPPPIAPESVQAEERQQPDVETLTAALYHALVAKSRRQDEEDEASPEFIERVYSRIQERNLAPILIALKNAVEREVIAAIGEVSERRADPVPPPIAPAAPLEKAGENGDMERETRIAVDKARLARAAAAMASAGGKPIAPGVIVGWPAPSDEEEPFVETVRRVPLGGEFD
ncbi:DUF3102 domain-containing protein [Methylosinus sp. H3A]|uniref:DUF3102 domain-containing protein n=1 Tax=Methylosinus sp. H3A TaxID=2785786 RepID=UPI0018C300AD|nr:DUF3102 domain-containing protein [Methylosinus sp. H3A]MBG0811217.1 DUF3102 domain-containing protein [Methylosinus sp. H3A]